MTATSLCLRSIPLAHGESSHRRPGLTWISLCAIALAMVLGAGNARAQQSPPADSPQGPIRLRQTPATPAANNQGAPYLGGRAQFGDGSTIVALPPAPAASVPLGEFEAYATRAIQQHGQQQEPRRELRRFGADLVTESDGYDSP